MIKVSVHYGSAAFRQAAGIREEAVEGGTLNLGQVLETLAGRHGDAMRRLIFREGDSLECFILVNGKSLRELGTALAEGDRLELLRFSAGG